MKTRLLALCLFIGLALGHGPAYAARTFTLAQTPSAATALFDMGSTQSLSYLVTNNTTTNPGTERIYVMRFRISSGSLFSGATAPAGWTIASPASFGTGVTTVTFQTSSWANAIAFGGSASFTLVLKLRSTTADTNEKLRDIRASYTLNTNPLATVKGGTYTLTPATPPTAPALPNAPGQWMLKSLAVTFQITDLSGVPISSLAAGASFRLVMTVKNNSTTSPQSGIVSNPATPNAAKTGSVTQALTGTAGSPLSLASLASGTITFTFSTAPSDNGTISFTALAQRSTTVTSKTATSPILTVAPCVFSANITASASCMYPGSNITLTMVLTNSCPYGLSTVTPSLSTTGPVTYVSGPTPSPIPIPTIAANGGAATVNWVYAINSNTATNPFTFSGSATSASPVMSTPTALSPSITRGEFPVDPPATNASSTNGELTWTVTNGGCAPVNSVAVTFPAGWVWANDAYSLVDLTPTNSVETWLASGTNPVTFTSPDSVNRLPVGASYQGVFSLVFSATPASAGISNFTVSVTDANGVVIPVSVPVTVNAFDPSGTNSVTNGIRTWREQFR